jgi:dihydroflavonol-4-reductase
MSAAPPILLTGASGFLGAALARHWLARGRSVHALARPAAAAELERAGLRVWRADLEQPASIAPAVAQFARAAGGGAPELVHSAALISYRARDARRSQLVNVEGTRALFDAWQRERLGRALFVSSVVAVGWAAHAHAPPLDEDAPFSAVGARIAYARTKRAAEDLVLASAGELDTLAVNPGAIFGLCARRSNTMRFLERLARGQLPALAPPGSLAAVGVDDVVSGIELALARGARGRRYILVEDNLSCAELYALALSARGDASARTARVLRVPAALWALAPFAALPLELLPNAHVTPTALRLLGLHARYDASRARRELGWKPASVRALVPELVRALLREGAGSPG